MAAFTFDPATMATGEATIDRQHRQLIATINTLVEAMSRGEGRDAISPMLDSLLKYTGTHFGYEESCMKRVACPVAAANERAHVEFVTICSAFADEYRRLGPSSALAIRLKSHVGDWLRAHIIGTDAKLRSCLPANLRATG